MPECPRVVRISTRIWREIRWPLLITSLVVTVLLSNLLNPLELMTEDLRFLLRGYISEPSSVVIVGITQASIARYGPLPWRRRLYAELIRGIKARGAALIGMDVFFPVVSPDHPDEDADLVKAVHDAGNVLLPVFCPVALKKYGQGPVYRVDRLQENFTELTAAALALGHINIPPAADGKRRSVPYALRYDNRLYFAFSVEAARRFAMISRHDAERVRNLPLTRSGNLLINY